MFERSDEDALRAVLASQEAARELSAAQIGSEHLLVGLVSKEWFASAQVLTMLGVTSSKIREAIGLPAPIEDRHRTGPHIPLDRSAKRTIERSTKEAKALRSDRIGTEHLLLALLRVEEGGSARVLNERGISHAVTLAAVTERPTRPSRSVVNVMGQPTPDPSASPIVGVVRDAIVEATGPSLVGLYVYGSLATGDFEPDVSDIDLIAVLSDRPDEALVRQLATMHEGLERAEPAWKDRIEVDYVSARGLARCRTDATTIVRISPGEPLHMIEASRDFLLDWYPARQDAIDLEGPRLDSLVPPIPEAEYLEEVRKYVAGFRDRFDDHATAGSHAYAILTMCRGLATLRFGDRLSKREAAARIQREFPRWSDLIDRALRWRDRQWRSDEPGGATTVAETRAFIADMDEVLERSQRPQPRA